MADHITRDELKAHLNPMRDSMTELGTSITNLNDKFGSYLEQHVRLDHHAQDIRELKDQSTALIKHKTETRIYWKLFGAVIALLAAGLVKALFF